MKNNKNLFKSGFTLAETLIVICILGVVVAITMPTMKSAIPDKYETMHKKAAFTLEKVVSEIVNNEDYYPQKREKDDSTGDIIVTRGLANQDAVTIKGTTYSGDSKFCNLLARKFNLKEGTTINCTDSAGLGQNQTPTFTSNDGIQWLVPVANFTIFNSSYDIKFKTSAKNDPHSTNCSSDQANCTRPDTFVYRITADGRLLKATPITDNIK